MLRERFWALTIEFWPNAVASGTKPTEGVTHRRHYFYFRHPPIREHFLEACRLLPWTSVWNETLLPILAKHLWPMIDFMHKSAGVELLDESKLVGRVSIYREDRWENQLVNVPAICEEIRDLTRRCKDKDGARRYVEEREYEIMEKLAAEPVEIDDEIRRVLVEGGFLKGKKRKALTPVQAT